MRITLGLVLVLFTTPLFAQSGPYAAQVEPSGSSPGYTIPSGLDAAVPWNSPSIVEWASAVVGTPVYGTGSVASDQNPAVALSSSLTPPSGADPASSLTLGGTHVVSLGENGSITVSFANPIPDGSGNDFAVFSNGFISPSWPDAYSKFATVSVSSDGTDFYAFPTYFGQDPLIGETFGHTTYYELFDASNLNNIAGKYVTGFGTPFDLNELTAVYPTAIEEGLLNLSDITEVRVTDAWETYDSSGNEILDAPGESNTFTGPSSGFNFGGIAVIPEPSTLVLATLAFVLMIWAGWRSQVRGLARCSADGGGN